MRTTAALLAGLVLGWACAPVAVVGAAIVVGDEFADHAQVHVVQGDPDFVWASVKSTMTHMTTDLIDVDEDLKAVQTYVEGALTTVHVQRYDVDQTRIRTASRKFLVYNDEIARMVQDRIVADLD